MSGLKDRIASGLGSVLEWYDFSLYGFFAPLIAIGIQNLNSKKRNIIPFCEIDFVDNFGKEIMRQRKIMGIKDGIILMQRFSKFNFMVTLGTGFSKFDAFEFLKRYHDKVHLIKTDLINLVEKDTRSFLPEEILNPPTHLSYDAK